MVAVVTIRDATKADLPAVSKLAGALVRLHHRWDAKRFFLIDDVEKGYAWWLDSQFGHDDVVLLVAELDGAVAGYLYATVEARDWATLRDACGALQDVYVDPSARRRGVAKALLTEGLSRLAAKGAPQVILMSATANAEAQALFESMGFRRTMVEMTRDG